MINEVLFLLRGQMKDHGVNDRVSDLAVISVFGTDDNLVLLSTN